MAVIMTGLIIVAFIPHLLVSEQTLPPFCFLNSYIGFFWDYLEIRLRIGAAMKIMSLLLGCRDQNRLYCGAYGDVGSYALYFRALEPLRRNESREASPHTGGSDRGSSINRLFWVTYHMCRRVSEYSAPVRPTGSRA